MSFPNGVNISVTVNTVTKVLTVPPQIPFNITASSSGPPGVKGDKGDQGIQGIQGPAGASGAGLTSKAGEISSGSFSGIPLKASVSFVIPFANTNYSIALSGQDARVFTYESKTANGFVINANSNGAITGEVSWIAMVNGEG
jgi:hypothetical protein